MRNRKIVVKTECWLVPSWILRSRKPNQNKVMDRQNRMKLNENQILVVKTDY